LWFSPPQRQSNPRSLFLKHTRAHSHTVGLDKRCRRHPPLREPPPPPPPPPFSSSPPHGGDFIAHVVSPASPNHPLSLIVFCLSASELIPLAVPRYLFFLLSAALLVPSSHSPLPPRSLQLNKQTNPLPPDTRLRRGDLLCLSGRILSDIVAPCQQKKGPGSWRGVHICAQGGLPPPPPHPSHTHTHTHTHTHGILPFPPHCLVCSVPMPGWLPCGIRSAECLPCFTRLTRALSWARFAFLFESVESDVVGGGL